MDAPDEFDWVLNGCDDRCEDYGIHEHFSRPDAFRWCWPKMDRRGVHDVTGQEIELPLGAVVCTVEVANAAEIATEDTGGDCWPTLEVSDSTLTYWRWGDGEHPDAHLDDQLPLGDFTPGRWGWMLSDPRPCDPVPCKGRQGVFELPVDLDERSAR